MSMRIYGWAIKNCLIAQTNQDSKFSQNRENSKMFNITPKYFSIFSNTKPAR